DVPVVLDDICMRGLAHDPSDRYATARDMAMALERAVPPASATVVGAWVESAARDVLTRRAALVREVERVGASTPPPPMMVAAVTTPRAPIIPGAPPTPRVAEAMTTPGTPLAIRSVPPPPSASLPPPG